MIDEIKDLQMIVVSALKCAEQGDTAGALKKIERAALLSDQILMSTGTRFSSVTEDVPEIPEIVNQGVTHESNS